MSTAKKSNTALWKRVVASVKAGTKGGNAGQWSARKAQIAVARYKKAGGGYKGAKSSDNSLSKWTKEEWGTKSGKPSSKTGERYLPKAARESLTPQEYAATTRAKRIGKAMGKQFVPQPKKIREKTAKFR
ncbi:MAG: hypothetical protein RLZZ184_844 [Cyanobacteriota bacterium]|jgi:hypothetical protein